MKQIILIALLLSAITVAAQTPKTIKAAWEIQQADNKKTNARIDSVIALFKPVIKPEEPKPEQSGKSIVDFVSAYYSSSNVELNGSVVTRIKGVKGPDLPYIGLVSPTITRPYLNAGEIVFTNQPNANFKVQTRENNNPFSFPDEQTIVFRKLPGTDWEALTSGWGNYYLGFSGTNIRAGNQDSYLKTAAYPVLFELTYVHCKYEADGVTIWMNGRNLGKIATTNIYRRLGYGVGIETNSTDFNWQATMFIEKGMTDQERAEYFKAIESTYKIGTLPALPYASDIKAVRQGSSLVASYKYNGVNAEDKTKVQYQWWKLSPDLGTQKMISTAASIPYQTGVKVTVKVTDAKGQSWQFVSGNYN